MLRLRNSTKHTESHGYGLLPIGLPPQTGRSVGRKRNHSTDLSRDFTCDLAWKITFLLFILSVAITGFLKVFHSDPPPRVAISGFALPFPQFGSQEYSERCNWVLDNANLLRHEGIIYVTTVPQGHEGLAQWVSGILNGFVVSKLLDAKLQIDYAPGVAIHDIIAPVQETIDWRVTPDFNCTGRCKKIYGLPSQSRIYSFERQLQPRIPIYRHASQTNNKKNVLQESDYVGLQQRLPGFHLDDGYACAFQALIKLSTTGAVKYQPDLFTRILPAMSDPSACVLTLYIRTGFADEMEDAHREQREAREQPNGPTRASRSVTNCALELEKLHSSSHSVWMVITDSSTTKSWVQSTFEDKNRKVLVTQSEGKHTRPGANPSTAAFAEGFLDWYLIGEAQAVITSNRWYSYGFMGAARTNRPFYEGTDDGNCTLVEWTFP